MVGGSPMPVAYIGRNPDDIARSHFLSRFAFRLHQSLPGNNDQGLPGRMRMPCGSRSLLKVDHLLTIKNDEQKKEVFLRIC